MQDTSIERELFYETLKEGDPDLGNTLKLIIKKYDKSEEKYLEPKKELNYRESLKVFLKNKC